MTKLKLGDYNRLKIVKRVDFGLYLDGGPEGEVLLPKRYVPQGANIGDEIEVFLYLDIDERLVATTHNDKATSAGQPCELPNQFSKSPAQTGLVARHQGDG